MKKFKAYLSENVDLLAQSDEQFLRAAIKAEQDAIILYEHFANKTQNERVKNVLLDVAKEEKVHVHEFEAILREIDDEENAAINQGYEEVYSDSGVEDEQ